MSLKRERTEDPEALTHVYIEYDNRYYRVGKHPFIRNKQTTEFERQFPDVYTRHDFADIFDEELALWKTLRKKDIAGLFVIMCAGAYVFDHLEDECDREAALDESIKDIFTRASGVGLKAAQSGYTGQDYIEWINAALQRKSEIDSVSLVDSEKFFIEVEQPEDGYVISF